MKPEELKAIMMAILSAGDQIATEVRRLKEPVFSPTPGTSIKKRVDGLWVESTKET